MFESIPNLCKTFMKRSYNVPINKEIVQHSQSISASVENRFIVMNYTDLTNEKVKYKYPLVWLRDNCQCPKCYHNHSKSRAINWELNRYNTEPKSVSVSLSEGKSFENVAMQILHRKC